MNNESIIQRVKCLSGSLTATACEKLRLSVLALFLGLLLLLTGRPTQPSLYSIFRIGTDLALARRDRFVCWYNLHMETTSLVAAIALTPYEDRETAGSVRVPTELLQTEMVAE
jgi:hypothetical protein